jgi:hypothetical protein
MNEKEKVKTQESENKPYDSTFKKLEKKVIEKKKNRVVVNVKYTTII